MAARRAARRAAAAANAKRLRGRGSTSACRSTSSSPTQLTGYYAPKNFNIWYFFGSLALVVLVLQLVTGIFLTMFYKPGELTSFDSVEFIMREVDWGWLIRYLHSTGASAFFIVVYLHMFRALPVRLVQGAARAVVALRHGRVPRAHGRSLHGLRAALGQHVLLGRAGDRQPVRHHSRRSARRLVEWIRGDYGIADATLNRFFALHVVAVPLATAAAGDAASGGAAAHGLEQSRRHRDQGDARRRRPSARRHPVSSRTTR